jgi:hypothetical protein
METVLDRQQALLRSVAGILNTAAEVYRPKAV